MASLETMPSRCQIAVGVTRSKDTLAPVVWRLESSVVFCLSPVYVPVSPAEVDWNFKTPTITPLPVSARKSHSPGSAAAAEGGAGGAVSSAVGTPAAAIAGAPVAVPVGDGRGDGVSVGAGGAAGAGGLGVGSGVGRAVAAGSGVRVRVAVAVGGSGLGVGVAGGRVGVEGAAVGAAAGAAVFVGGTGAGGGDAAGGAGVAAGGGGVGRGVGEAVGAAAGAAGAAGVASFATTTGGPHEAEERRTAAAPAGRSPFIVLDTRGESYLPLACDELSVMCFRTARTPRSSLVFPDGQATTTRSARSRSPSPKKSDLEPDERNEYPAETTCVREIPPASTVTRAPSASRVERNRSWECGSPSSTTTSAFAFVGFRLIQSAGR